MVILRQIYVVHSVLSPWSSVLMTTFSLWPIALSVCLVGSRFVWLVTRPNTNTAQTYHRRKETVISRDVILGPHTYHWRKVSAVSHDIKLHPNTYHWRKVTAIAVISYIIHISHTYHTLWLLNIKRNILWTSNGTTRGQINTDWKHYTTCCFHATSCNFIYYLYILHSFH